MNWQSFLGGLGQVGTGLAPILSSGSQLYGQQNASEAVSKANNAAIGNQSAFLGNIGTMFSPYTSLGTGATGALGRAEGLNGAAPDYSGFLNMPGYQFAVQQGTQALQRQAAASGSAYTPQTQAAIGQYVTGTAMQDYNNYINQLQGAAGLGAQATGQLGNITYNTGANISQLMANTGQSQAGMYTGAGQTFAGAMGPGYGRPGGFNSSGVGGIVGGIGNIARGIGTMFAGGPGGDPNNSGDMTGGQYNGGAFGGGAPYYDPSTGGYPGDTGSQYGNIPTDSSGNPVWDWTGQGPG